MSARDQCEPQIIRAFERDGWAVTDHPLTLRLARDERLLADLRFVHTSDTRTVIVIEVKCFPDGNSQLQEFYMAVGQYLTYRAALEMTQVAGELYLAVPLHIYDNFLKRKLMQLVLNNAKIQLVVVDLGEEKIVRWLT